MTTGDSAKRRLKFYGLNDYGTYYQVERATEILEGFDLARSSYSLADIFELHSALQYAQAELFSSICTDEQRSTFKALAPKLRETIARFFSSVDEANISTALTEIDFYYHDDLLGLLARHRVYQRCAASTILPALDAIDVSLSQMLRCKALVREYDPDMRARLCSAPRNAELVISKHLERNPRQETFLPRSFNSSDSRALIEAYVDGTEANPNFVALVANARVLESTGIDAKLKLKAKRKYDQLVEEIFKDNRGMETGFQVSISDSQADPVQVSMDGPVAIFSYGRQWLEDGLDNPTILNNFVYVFEFANPHMLLTLPSYYAELGTFERHILTGGKDSYTLGTAFRMKEQVSFLQTLLYDSFLQTYDKNLESVIEWFFAIYLRDEFGADKFKLKPSSKAATYLERCRHIFSEMESVVRQFSLYVENGQMDAELLGMTSDQVRYREIPSLLVGKYVYVTANHDIRSIQHYLFSDQSPLTYISDELRAENAAALLIKYQVSYSDFAGHQKPAIDYLIAHGVLENTDGRVQFTSASQFWVLKRLFDMEVASYYHHPAESRLSIDKMVGKGWLERRNSLLSRAEASYFSYCLNNAEFSDGPALRNRYMHGSHPNVDDDNEHFNTYITTLKLLIALLIKINDDFWLRAAEPSREARPQ